MSIPANSIRSYLVVGVECLLLRFSGDCHVSRSPHRTGRAWSIRTLRRPLRAGDADARVAAAFRALRSSAGRRRISEAAGILLAPIRGPAVHAVLRRTLD